MQVPVEVARAAAQVEQVRAVAMAVKAEATL
jgi:hypothetical protein